MREGNARTPTKIPLLLLLLLRTDASCHHNANPDKPHPEDRIEEGSTKLKWCGSCHCAARGLEEEWIRKEGGEGLVTTLFTVTMTIKEEEDEPYGHQLDGMW